MIGHCAKVVLVITGCILVAGCGAKESATSPLAANEDGMVVLVPPPVDTAEREAGEMPRVMIEIQGAVLRPGAYEFSPETRIQEAIERAGGALDVAEIRDINIAARLIDGSVLSIPYQQNYEGVTQATAALLNPPTYVRSLWRLTAEPKSANSREVGAGEGGCINLNTATQQELESLPGVGEKTAEKIVRYRALQPFEHVDDLLNIQGIGDKKLASWRSQLCV